MESLEAEIRACTRCGLHETRINAVPGEGPADARVVFIGEAPGHNEDKMGRPFVGAAGKLLDGLLGNAGLKREEIFIGNILKCRPPQNRDPADEEIETCTPYLEKQILLIKPKLIVSLGRFAARAMLGHQVAMGQSHGTLADCSFGGWQGKLFIAYHPAAALYGMSRSELEDDFKKLGEVVKGLDDLKVSRQATLEFG